MSVNDFANVGVFVIAMIGFALGTGLFGVLFGMLIASDDWKYNPLVSWLVGILVYGMTVMFMWRW